MIPPRPRLRWTRSWREATQWLPHCLIRPLAVTCQSRRWLGDRTARPGEQRSRAAPRRGGGVGWFWRGAAPRWVVSYGYGRAATGRRGLGGGRTHARGAAGRCPRGSAAGGRWAASRRARWAASQGVRCGAKSGAGAACAAGRIRYSWTCPGSAFCRGSSRPPTAATGPHADPIRFRAPPQGASKAEATGHTAALRLQQAPGSGRRRGVWSGGGSACRAAPRGVALLPPARVAHPAARGDGTSPAAARPRLRLSRRPEAG
mmetsp:Transcript_37224/g.119662  ORF Transcript_37224/g.119662 Transcript_37224/m.119662 type:complete len:260 (+) Transcript_37224:150-929(+)